MKAMMNNDILVNAHLHGRSFLWEDGKTAVLLLHGLTATASEVRLLGQNLHQHGYTVAAPLLPGHGTTPEALSQVKWTDWAWEAEKSLHYLLTVCDTVFVAGESMGGALTLHLATRFPEIAGIICYAPAIKLNIPPIRKVQLRTTPFKEFVPKKNSGDNDFWQGYAVNSLSAVEELLQMGRAVRHNLHKIECPVLVVQGRHDVTVASDVGDVILTGVSSRQKRQVWMENSAHIILLEDEREQIFSLTREFLDDVLRFQSGSLS